MELAVLESVLFPGGSTQSQVSNNNNEKMNHLMDPSCVSGIVLVALHVLFLVLLALFRLCRK